jgi:hypothetical protein
MDDPEHTSVAVERFETVLYYTEIGMLVATVLFMVLFWCAKMLKQ